MEVFNWIFENKEWLFSGILVVIGAWFLNFLKNMNRKSNDSVNIQKEVDNKGKEGADIINEIEVIGNHNTTNYKSQGGEKSMKNKLKVEGDFNKTDKDIHGK